MSLPTTFFLDLVGENETGAGSVVSQKLALPANNGGVRALVRLTEVSHNGQTSTWGANAYINEYTKNGQPVQGQFHQVFDAGISEVQFKLDVYGTKAYAHLMVEVF